MSDWLDAEAHADRALEMYERGRWAEAETELRKALSLNPEQGEWHFNLGLTLEASGRDAEALTWYERAADLMPNELDPKLYAGAAANRVGQFERALRYFEQCIQLEAQCESAYASRMESLIRLGHHDEAETVFYLAQQAVDDASGHCLAMMAEVMMFRDKFERATWCLTEALRLDPTIPRLRARLATVYAATGKQQRALQLFLRELRDDPGNIDTLLDFGDLLVQVGRLPEAAEKFRRVLELEPANVDAHYRLGDIALRRRRYEPAHIEFELVYKLDPEFPQVRVALAEALLDLQRHEDAIRLLRDELADLKTRRTDRRQQDDLVRFGGLLLRADLSKDAAWVLDRAHEQLGDDPLVLRRLARARYEAGDRAGGSAISRRLLRREPECIQSMHNLALAALVEGRLRTASGWIRRGLAVDRHDVDLRRLRLRLWMKAAASAVNAWMHRLRHRIHPQDHDLDSTT